MDISTAMDQTRPTPVADERYDAARLRQVAEEFTAIFARSLLRQGEDPFAGGPISGVEQSPAEQHFQSLLHDELAERGAGGLGLSDVIHRWLVTHAPGASAGSQSPGDPS